MAVDLSSFNDHKRTLLKPRMTLMNADVRIHLALVVIRADPRHPRFTFSSRHRQANSSFGLLQSFVIRH
jgi:hypothetical protein